MSEAQIRIGLKGNKVAISSQTKNLNQQQLALLIATTEYILTKLKENFGASLNIVEDRE